MSEPQGETQCETNEPQGEMLCASNELQRESPSAVSASILGLAYLGDAVFELCVRDMLVRGNNISLDGYNKLAKTYVAAVRQSAMYRKIFPLLNEEEQSVLKRGRNINTSSRAKHASVSDYRHATGLEALFGYLYAAGRHDRLREVFELCVTKPDAHRSVAVKYT